MPVEAVKNSSQINNRPAYCDYQVARSSLYDDIDLSGSLFRDRNDFGNFDMEESRLFSNILGVGAYNPRVLNAYKQQTIQESINYENQNVTEDDRNNLKPLSEELDKYRIFGMRYLYKNEVKEILEGSEKAEKGVALYLTNCAENGLKDKNQPISFKNLKNPLKLIHTLKDPYIFRAPQANEKIETLCNIAIKGRSPGMAAALLEGTSEGGLLGGVDSKTAEILLIKSKDKFDNEADYHKFITDIDIAYKNMFKEKSLDTYLNDNYKPVSQKTTIAGELALGTSIGLKRGGVKGAVVGAIIGGIAGFATYSSALFGKNNEGEKLHDAIMTARQKSSYVNVQKYTFGSNTLGLGMENEVSSLI